MPVRRSRPGLALIVALLATGALARADGPTHWAFVPPGRPDLPAVRHPDWARNPIDRFVLASLEAAGLTPSPEAGRATLIRRLTFDLTGLPPTPEAVAAFDADDRPEAYERLVDRLLASPHFGERRAQHWLDLARYADTDGFEFDEARPDAWRYRDWVVRAANADLPADRFLALQLAGDEIAPGDSEAFIATGFNRCYPDMVDLNDQGLRRQNALNDITETTALAVLGLTIGCARCHDHKFDPIPQTDFFALQAFFSPARFRDDFPVQTPEAQAEHAAAVAAWKAGSERLRAAAEAASGGEAEALRKRLADREQAGPPPGPKARGLDEAGPAAAPTFLLVRGEYGSHGPEVRPAFPTALRRAGEPAEPTIAPGPRSTGRRSALAAWLTRPDHPLTGRVLVNRVWQQHFGRGLVGTASDFGTMGDEPTHPELLDWLATEFTNGPQSLKALHRQIVTSATYRQASDDRPELRQADPEGQLLGRQSRRRLDGEAIRDALLLSSGRLNPALGGPGVFPPLPEELTRLSSKGAIWPTSPRESDRNRRSLYVFVRRNLRYPFFEAFDRPDTNASCPRRPVTTIAPQALTLLNGSDARHAARALADRLAIEAGDSPGARVDRAYRLTLGRGPDAEEARLALAFVRDGGPDAWTGLALALLNLNEFVYLD